MASSTLYSELIKNLDKNIKDICTHSFTSNINNHCAHFVSHVMGYSYGFKCKGMTGLGDGVGATIRVHELFSECGTVGEWDSRESSVDCLAFVTASKNVSLATKRMTNVPAKHVGIFCKTDDKIYHYSNSRNKVVCQSPDDFAKHYKGSDIKVYYGTFPTGTFKI